MTDSQKSIDSDTPRRFRVDSEPIGNNGRSIRMSLKDPMDGDREIGHFFMKDFGKFTYFSGMRVEPKFRKQGIGNWFVKKAQEYLESAQPPKFGMVSNQISRINGARSMYSPPNWYPLSEHNWMIYVPRSLRNPSDPLKIPLIDAEIDDMLRICKKN